jgi:hypothetical protein
MEHGRVALHLPIERTKCAGSAFENDGRFACVLPRGFGKQFRQIHDRRPPDTQMIGFSSYIER